MTRTIRKPAGDEAQAAPEQPGNQATDEPTRAERLRTALIETRSRRIAAAVRAEKVLTDMIARYGDKTPLGSEQLAWLHERIARELDR